ncbi:MAG: hypothetical protein DRI54_00825 [Bacteroidetes bacterium]|nr:MAG: hypothetical protein DRI54_00825 [Bacteroidota bacterium]
MTFTDFVYETGDILEATFTILPSLGNIPNYLFIGIGVIGFLYWMNLQVKYNKAASKGESRQ